MDYISHGDHTIQKEKAWLNSLEDGILVLILPLYNLKN